MRPQASEPLVPLRFEGSEPVVERPEGSSAQLVHAAASLDPAPYELGLLEEVEMLRHCLAGHRETPGELGE